MRILADENFPRIAVEALASLGHDVLWVQRDMPGASDREILARAQSDQRIVITFDKDFGELAFRHKLAATYGIVLFRIPMRSPEFVAEIAALVFQSRNDWAGHFSTVESSRIRMVPLS